MTRPIRWSLIVLSLLAGLAVMNYFAPLQPCSVVFDLALVVALAGLVSLIVPLRFLEIRDRRSGAFVLLAGCIAGAMALNWPAPLARSSRAPSVIDEFMPEYIFAEFHSAMVHAEPERVYVAVQQTTFADLKVYAVLMQLRQAAAGRFNRVKAPDVPILEVMTRPGSGFVLLGDDGRRELVMGLAGKFWSKGSAPKITTREEFLAFRQPGSAKSVFNILIEDAGDGWSKVSTETRALGADEGGSRAMARYWRVIYPGTATIRRMWLNAIKSRAEGQRS